MLFKEPLQNYGIRFIKGPSEPFVWLLFNRRCREFLGYIILVSIFTQTVIDQRTLTSVKNLMTRTMLTSRKSLKQTICASFPNRTLLARFWIIFAITRSPRRIAAFSCGRSTSIVLGETNAGEMNLIHRRSIFTLCS